MSNRILSTLAAAVLVVTSATAAKAQTGNLLSNGRFDTAIAPWPATFNTYGFLAFDGTEDADGCAESGAAAASSDPNVDSGGSDFGVCVSGISGGVDYLIQAAFRIPNDDADGYANVHPNFFDQPGCTGNLVEAFDFIAGDAHPDVSTWQRFSHIQASPVGAQSVRIKIHLLSFVGAEGPLEVLADEIVFATADYIFADDFEVQDPCRWSATQP